MAFLNDCSSEVLARILPLYLTLVLGASPAFVGVVEGLAESASVFLKGFSGWLSDRLPSRKGLVLGGYGLSVVARGLFLLPIGPILVGASRVLDRVGKGLRSAPRDAMVADAAVAGRWGRDFGITRFLDTLGAMAGLALVLALGVGRGPMSAATFRACVWLALPLGLATLALLLFWVPRVPRATPSSKRLCWRVPGGIRGYLVRRPGRVPGGGHGPGGHGGAGAVGGAGQGPGSQRGLRLRMIDSALAAGSGACWANSAKEVRAAARSPRILAGLRTPKRGSQIRISATLVFMGPSERAPGSRAISHPMGGPTALGPPSRQVP